MVSCQIRDGLIGTESDRVIHLCLGGKYSPRKFDRTPQSQRTDGRNELPRTWSQSLGKRTIYGPRHLNSRLDANDWGKNGRYITRLLNKLQKDARANPARTCNSHLVAKDSAEMRIGRSWKGGLGLHNKLVWHTVAELPGNVLFNCRLDYMPKLGLTSVLT